MERWTVINDRGAPVSYVNGDSDNTPPRMIVFEDRFDAYKWVVENGASSDEVVKIKFEVVR